MAIPSGSDSTRAERQKGDPRQVVTDAIAELQQLDQALYHLNDRYAQCLSVSYRGEEPRLTKHLLEMAEVHFRDFEFRQVLEDIRRLHLSTDLCDQVQRVVRVALHQFLNWQEKVHQCLASERYDSDLGIEARKIVFTTMDKLQWIFPRQMEQAQEYSSVREREPPLMRQFCLADLSINQEEFLREIAPTFAHLEPDTYDMRREQMAFLQDRLHARQRELQNLFRNYYEGSLSTEVLSCFIRGLNPGERESFLRIAPYRYRAKSSFRVQCHEGCWSVEDLPHEPFVQAVSRADVRALARTFPEIVPTIVRHEGIRQFLTGVAAMTKERQPQVFSLRMNLHQIRVVARDSSSGQSSPEGPHQDGNDFVVPALVVARENITGGESELYDLDDRLLFSIMLKPGEATFNDDRRLKHHARPIQKQPGGPGEEGHRDFFGVDVVVEH